MVSFSDLQGLKFAQKQLEKHGWRKGKGLGKDEDGRADAIKVGVKNDTLGVGYDVGRDFTNHWWDHMFNKAASNIVVEHSENGIQVSKKDTSVGEVSRPKKFWRVKGEHLYYGRFVKAKNDSDETAKQKTEDHPVKTKFSDEELLEACGGRTAHKSARHGHKLSGKLKRIAEQEDIRSNPVNQPTDALMLNNSGDVAVNPKKKKKRRKEPEVDREKNQKCQSVPESSFDTNPLWNTGDRDACVGSNVDPGVLGDHEIRMTLGSSESKENGKRKRKGKKRNKDDKPSREKVDKSQKKKRKRSKQK